MESHLCHLTAWSRDNYLTSLCLRFLINGNKNSKYLTGEENKLLSLMLSTECYRCYIEISTDAVLSLVFLLFLYKCKSLKTSPKKAFVEISQYLWFSYLSLSLPSFSPCLLVILSFSPPFVYVLFNCSKFPGSHLLLCVKVVRTMVSVTLLWT